MKIFALTFFNLLFLSSLFAQNNEIRPTNESKIKLNHPNISRATKQTEPKVSKTLTPEQKQTISDRAATKQALLKPNEILLKYLGVSSYEEPTYKQKKEKLYYENPDAYKEMCEKLDALNTISKAKISRAEYNNFPKEKKDFIDRNLDKYEITD